MKAFVDILYNFSVCSELAANHTVFIVNRECGVVLRSVASDCVCVCSARALTLKSRERKTSFLCANISLRYLGLVHVPRSLD